MGEVYQATDTRLGRSVAIKVLSPHLAVDEAVKRRFRREARAISALNHPHICGLYDIGAADGHEFLVMELLEGQTLAARLTQGPIPPQEAMESAVQIASALERAHRQGIIHRDLKPANIMLTKSGAKLLDFGLARTMESEGTSSALSADDAVIGTIEYMAPEQLNGNEADARSDLFAFGVVLYEMLTGIRPFVGRNRASVIGAILFSSPQPAREHNSDLPPAVDRLLGACLHKDPEERLQTAHDLRLQLEWIRDGESGASPRPHWRPRRLLVRVASALLILAAVAAIIAMTSTLKDRPDSRPDRQLRFSFPSPLPSSELAEAVLSPDGRELALVMNASDGRKSLWLRSLRSGSLRELPGTEGATQPFWSPDSAAIGFYGGSLLKTIRISADSPQQVAEARGMRGGSWNSSSTILFAPIFTGPLYTIPSIGGEMRPVTTLDKAAADSSHRWPEFLPDGEHFIFVVESQKRNRAGLYVGSLRSNKIKRISPNTNKAAIAGNRLLFVQDGKLFAQEFDLGTLETQGNATLIAERVSVDTKVTGHSAFSVSTTGLLAVVSVPTTTTSFHFYDRQGKQLDAVPAPAGHYLNPSLSHDERLVAATRVDPVTGKNSVFTIDLTTGRANRLIVDDANSDGACFSIDGRTVYFGNDRSGRYQLFEKPVDGSAPERRVAYPRNAEIDLLAATRAGLLLVERSSLRDQPMLWRPGSEPKRLPIVDDTGETVMSPDGNWFTYVSRQLTGTREIFVQSVADPGVKYQITQGGGNDPRFSADGREIYYTSSSRDLMAVTFTPPRLGVPKPLFKMNLANVEYGHADYMPMRDGRFLINTRSNGDERAVATVVVNWDRPE
jgi:serine/threonine protein kinase